MNSQLQIISKNWKFKKKSSQKKIKLKIFKYNWNKIMKIKINKNSKINKMQMKISK